MHKNVHLSKFTTKYKAMQCWVACLSTWLWISFFYFWPSTVTRQANSMDNIATANMLWLHAVKKLQYCMFFVRNYYLYHTVLNLVFTRQLHKRKPHSVDAHSLWGTSAESLSSVTFSVQTHSGTQKSEDALKIWIFLFKLGNKKKVSRVWQI